MLKRFCIICALATATCTSSGEEPLRPVASAWTAEVGTSHLADTYLSPVKYSGLHFGLAYGRMQAMKRTTLAQGWNVSLGFDRALNPAGNAAMLCLDLEGGWRLMRRWRLPYGFSAGIGGYVGVRAGVLYLSRNGNNPAQALASATVGPEGYAQWSGRLGRLPLSVRWQASVPLAGAFFCPDYGELYYEIALGNRRNLAHFAWPANYRRLKSLLSVDLHLGKSTLRLGYGLEAMSTHANHITSRRITHSAVIGVVCDFITINSQKHDRQTVTAYY